MLGQMIDRDRHARRIQTLAGHGLASALAAIVVMIIFGAGSQPAIALGGLALAAVAFAALIAQPQRALAPIPRRRRLPPSRER